MQQRILYKQTKGIPPLERSAIACGSRAKYIKPFAEAAQRILSLSFLGGQSRDFPPGLAEESIRKQEHGRRQQQRCDWSEWRLSDEIGEIGAWRFRSTFQI